MGRSPGGLLLIVAGVVLVVAGVLWWAGWLSWFGRLPGDIRIERPGVRIYIPIVTMLLVSIIISLIAALFRR